MREKLAIDYPALKYFFSIEYRYEVVAVYLDASRNSINFTKDMTLSTLVSTNWLMSGTHIDDMGVIQKSTGVSVTKVVFPLGQCILICTDERLDELISPMTRHTVKAYPSEVQCSICCLIR
jgi:hypothetical protein